MYMVGHHLHSINSFGGTYNKAPYLLLGKAIEKGVSSKISSGHMGCGLWLVNEYVTKMKGYMCIYSESGYLVNKRGIVKCGESPYWKGTIIYVDIPLHKPSHLKEVFQSVKTKEQYI